MPLIPRGLTPGFVQRIQEGVRNLGLPSALDIADRTVQRVRREINDRLPGGGAPRGDFGEAADVAMSPIPSDVADVMARIERAASRWLMIFVAYHDQERFLEPYSYRYRDADDPHIPLVYCYCHKDKATEAFKLKKFQRIEITKRQYGPPGKWDNEFAVRQ